MPIDKLKEHPENVTYTQLFAAVIRKGPQGNKLVVKSPRWYQYQLDKFKDGEAVSLVVHNRKLKRTEQQNRYYWGVYLPKIAEETGEADLGRLHELFKGKFLTESIVEVLNEKVRIKKSSAMLSKSEFSQYIMDIEAFTGIESPPTENYGLYSIREFDIGEKELSTDNS